MYADENRYLFIQFNEQIKHKIFYFQLREFKIRWHLEYTEKI